MAVAKFGSTSEWAGKKITREGDVFVAQDHGEISPAAIMENDRQGRLVWVNDGTRAWVGSLARRLRSQAGRQDVTGPGEAPGGAERPPALPRRAG